jgi:hypothetical protein
VESSDNNVVENNTVVAPPGTSMGIRLVVQQNRREPQYVYCVGKQPKSAVNNTVRANTIIMQGDDLSYNGLMNTGSDGRYWGNSFSLNRYVMTGCEARRWKWRTPEGMTTVNFTTWQSSFGQDRDGLCAA